MPYRIRKSTGKRPWKIVRLYRSGHTMVVGSSLTKKEAEKSIVARHIHERK
jgi:hypothetical protein